MWRKITSRGLQVFVAGALAVKGFSAWLGFAYSLSVGSTATAFIWALVGVNLLMALGLLIGSRAMVRAVQIYLLFLRRYRHRDHRDWRAERSTISPRILHDSVYHWCVRRRHSSHSAFVVDVKSAN